mgnify:FL=1
MMTRMKIMTMSMMIRRDQVYYLKHMFSFEIFRVGRSNKICKKKLFYEYARKAWPNTYDSLNFK